MQLIDCKGVAVADVGELGVFGSDKKIVSRDGKF